MAVWIMFYALAALFILSSQQKKEKKK